jgi:hypothetical protein
LPELTAFLPAALTASVAMQLAASFDPHATGAAANVAIGVLLGFTAAPCALGSVAVAGALHARAPLAAASFLCVAGIVDARALRLRILPRNSGHDALAYVMLTIALASVAWRHGAALVHPAIAGVLAACALVTAALALVHRSHQCARARVAPAIVLAGAMLSAPPPVYRATETTLSGLFAGERLSFTGVVVRGARSDALVRFAITCCRADATPVGVRLAQRATERTGSWVRADGTVEGAALDLRLRVTSLQQIAPPADPFIYR